MSDHLRSRRRTCLICTVTPPHEGGKRPQDSDRYLVDLIREGMDVARVNLSHVPGAKEFALGNRPDYSREEDLLRRIRAASDAMGPERHVAVLLDLQGIKIRLRVPGGRRGGGLAYAAGETLRMRFSRTPPPDALACDGSQQVMASVRAAVEREGRVDLAVGDGTPILSCCAFDGDTALLTADEPGLLVEGKGLMFRGVDLPNEPALPEKDRVDLACFALPAVLHGAADFLALSFTRSAADVERLRGFCRCAIDYFREGVVPDDDDDAALLKRISAALPDLGRRYVTGSPMVRVVAKIETGDGVDNIDEILETADAVMVARGDLGLACAPEEVPIHQKNILRRARLMGRPAIVATQMLQSMERDREPMRPEASDVFNAVLDGADALMLSAETATGVRPTEVTRTLARIIDSAEAWEEDAESDRRASLRTTFRKASHLREEKYAKDPWLEVTDRVTFEVVRLAEALRVTAIVAATRSGRTALHIARFHPRVPVVAVVPDARVARSLAIVSSVRPVVDPAAYAAGALEAGILRSLEVGALEPGDLIVAAFARLRDPPGVTSSLSVRTAGLPEE